MLSRGCWTAQVQNISIITETSSGQHSCRRQKTSLSNVSLLKQWIRFPKSSCLLTALPEDQKKTSLAFFFSCILLPSLTSLKKLQTMLSLGKEGCRQGSRRQWGPRTGKSKDEPNQMCPEQTPNFHHYSPPTSVKGTCFPTGQRSTHRDSLHRRTFKGLVALPPLRGTSSFATGYDECTS